WYDNALGDQSVTITDEKLQAKGIRSRIGPHKLDFLMPLGPESPLAHWVQTFGPSPYAATLYGSLPSRGAFDIKLTHGANLSLVQ
ncbi:MAG TPA: hypothetical protein VEG60_22210, partial [Candidatus Binatia bacterium]|nr:hypothetical protein [Candidatus Binatia bacterium]